MSLENESLEFTEVERYELRETGSYRFNANRREFVQVLGAGLMIVSAADQADAQPPGNRGGQRSSRSEEKLSERFHISEDGVVTVLTSKVEAGQGSRTQITQAVAEELHVPVDQIKLIMADTATVRPTVTRNTSRPMRRCDRVPTARWHRRRTPSPVKLRSMSLPNWLAPIRSNSAWPIWKTGG